MLFPKDAIISTDESDTTISTILFLSSFELRILFSVRYRVVLFLKILLNTAVTSLTSTGVSRITPANAATNPSGVVTFITLSFIT